MAGNVWKGYNRTQNDESTPKLSVAQGGLVEGTSPVKDIPVESTVVVLEEKSLLQDLGSVDS